MLPYINEVQALVTLKLSIASKKIIATFNTTWDENWNFTMDFISQSLKEKILKISYPTKAKQKNKMNDS